MPKYRTQDLSQETDIELDLPELVPAESQVHLLTLAPLGLAEDDR